MKELHAYFDHELPLVDDRLAGLTRDLDPLVREVAQYVLLAPGKRIRPILTMLCARALGYSGDDIYPLACALELLHTASLLHDDILDGATLRRGRDAAHLTFGEKRTILAGDALLALANKIGAQYGLAEISFHLAQGAMDTAVGEIREIALSKEPSMDREAYMQVVTGKTACLIRTSLLCGAALAGADKACKDAAQGYGLSLGIAFQLVDDALDYSHEADATGKPAGQDIREGKVTLPLILLLEGKDEARSRSLLADLKARRLDDDAINALVDEVRDQGLAERTREMAALHAAEATKHLAAFPDSHERLVLEQAAAYVLTRNR